MKREAETESAAIFFHKKSGLSSRSNPLKSANEKKSDGSRENFSRNCPGEKYATWQTVSGNISSYTNHTKQIFTLL